MKKQLHGHQFWVSERVRKPVNTTKVKGAPQYFSLQEFHFQG
jgi:hypothetical protein